jgi:hypothetical protein
MQFRCHGKVTYFVTLAAISDRVSCKALRIAVANHYLPENSPDSLPHQRGLWPAGLRIDLQAQ